MPDSGPLNTFGPKAEITTDANKALVQWFQDIDRSAINEVGGKGANLAEIGRAGLPVPDGFVVTVRAYQAFLEASGLGERAAEIMAHLNVDAPASLRDASRSLRKLVTAATVPDDI